MQLEEREQEKIELKKNLERLQAAESLKLQVAIKRFSSGRTVR